LFDHIGLRVGNVTRSRAFHAATLAPLDIQLVTATDELWSGGRDEGPRGVRASYRYGAFAFDPDNHNSEAVCHAA